MVKQINRLSDKKPREKIKVQEKIRQELKRPALEKEKRIDFYPRWKPQQGVREEEEEGEEYLSKGEDRRPYIKLRRKQTIGRNRKEAEDIMQTGRGRRRILIRRRG